MVSTSSDCGWYHRGSELLWRTVVTQLHISFFFFLSGAPLMQHTVEWGANQETSSRCWTQFSQWICPPSLITFNTSNLVFSPVRGYWGSTHLIIIKKIPKNQLRNSLKHKLIAQIQWISCHMSTVIRFLIPPQFTAALERTKWFDNLSAMRMPQDSLSTGTCKSLSLMFNTL
jgi:hypothetical protein